MDRAAAGFFHDRVGEYVVTITQVSGQASGVTANVNSNTKAYPNSVATGNMASIGCFAFQNGTKTFTAGMCTKSTGTATITSPTLDVFAAFNYNGGGGSWIFAAIWSATVTAGGSLTMSVNPALSSGTMGISVDEFHSTLGSAAIAPSAGVTNSAHSGTGGSSTTDVNSGNVTPPASGGQVLLLGCGVDSDDTNSNAQTYTANNGFTNEYNNITGQTFMSGAMAFNIVAAGSAAILADWTTAFLTRTLGAIAAYQESSGGGSTRPVKMAGEWGGFAGESGGFAGRSRYGLHIPSYYGEQRIAA